MTRDENAEQSLQRLVEEIKNLPPDRIEQLENILRAARTKGAENVPPKKLVSLKDAAKMLDMNIITLRRAIKSGFIKGIQLPRRENSKKGGNWKVSIEEIERFTKGENK